MNAGGDMPVLSNFYKNTIRRGFIMDQASMQLCMELNIIR